MLRLSLQTGFSLLELLVVLMLISVVGTIAIRSTVDIGYATRYEQTRDRLESIRTAIIGNPKRSINGQPDISGFVADMGRLPVNVRELVQRLGDCDDDNFDYSATDCTNNGGTWTAGVWNDDAVSIVDTNPNTNTKLRHGWNGPYLNISGDPSLGDAYTDGWGREAQGYCSDPAITLAASCTGSDVWTAVANDFNYGWYFDSSTSPDLTLFSYGRDGVSGGSTNDYTADYPVASTMISLKDWEVSVSRGIDVGFVKLSKRSEISVPPPSFCSNASYQTKATCEGASEVWYGGCTNQVGFFNTASCTAAGGTWASCSDGTSATRIACEAVPAVWYGVGAGCSDQQYIDKDTCSAVSETWHNCSDGSNPLATEGDCLSAGGIWYGDTLYTLADSATFGTQQVCLKLFYRGPNSTINTEVSTAPPLTITEDGAYQSLHFSFSVATIPAGVNAVGLYKHDGTNCTNILYPDDRTAVVPVLARGGSDFPFVNW